MKRQPVANARATEPTAPAQGLRPSPSRRARQNGQASQSMNSRSAGNPPAQYPALRGQYATYVAAQLRAYRAGTRQTDPNQMMRNVASSMSDEQIDAVASYVQGLREVR